MTEVKGPKRFVVGVYCLLPVWSPPCEAEGLLAVAVGHAFHGTLPRRFTQTALPGPAARVLLGPSAHASRFVARRRGSSGSAGLLLGSAGAAHARCPVLVFHKAIAAG